MTPSAHPGVAKEPEIAHRGPARPQESLMPRHRFTSESVTEGHPDKVCDAISDAVLDGILAQDPKARVACEALAKTGMVVVAGEITTTAWVDMPQVVRDTVREIGYVHSEMG